MNLRLLYLYLFSFIGLLITIIGCIRLVDLGLKTYIFTASTQVVIYPRPVMDPEADKNLPTPEQETEFHRLNQRQMQANTVAESLAMIVVGAPIYLYHWITIKKEQA